MKHITEYCAYFTRHDSEIRLSSQSSYIQDHESSKLNQTNNRLKANFKKQHLENISSSVLLSSMSLII